MASAVCSKCGQPYRWHGCRGSRLADNPSPCCNAPGKAVVHDWEGRKQRVIKKCPDCGKAGLWWRKALRRDQPCDARFTDADPYYGGMYCPRCKKWVKPIREQVGT